MSLLLFFLIGYFMLFIYLFIYLFYIRLFIFCTTLTHLEQKFKKKKKNLNRTWHKIKQQL